MNKRAVIVHGWEANPSSDFFPWLKKELESRGYQVDVPTMPETDNPVIKDWVGHLSKVIGTPNEDIILIGHSIGAQAILRYLENLPAKQSVGLVVCIAGWFTLKNITDEDLAIIKPWVETPIDCEKVLLHTDRIVAIFSDNDPVVPLENKDLFENKLFADTVIESGKGHFNESDGVIELPEIFKYIDSI